MRKIINILLIVEFLLVTFVVLYIAKIAMGQTIGIGVSPVVVEFDFPGVYDKTFCFFNKGDTDAVYKIVSGDIGVLGAEDFIVPAGTNITNCVKKNLRLVARCSGYFYVEGAPAVSTAGGVSIVRRVGVKVLVKGCPLITTTTTTTTTTTNVSTGQATGISTFNGTNQTYTNYTTTTIPRTTTTVISNLSNASGLVVINETLREKDSLIFDFKSLVLAIVVLLILIAVAYIILQFLAT